MESFTKPSYIQWNPSKADTIGTKNLSAVARCPYLVIDHAPPTIVASYDKALLWTTMKTVLMQLTASEQEFETYFGFSVVLVAETDRF